jgi:hypothetical protein
MDSLSHATALVDLCRQLGREEDACRALLETVQEERAAIRRLAIAEFHPINCKRLAVLESLQRLSQETDGMVRSLAAKVGLPPTTSLQGCMDRLGPEESLDLRARHVSFMEAAKTVRAEIGQNAVLIEGIRGLIDQALSAGSAAVPGQDGYGSDGRRMRTPSANVLLYQQG